MILWKQFFKTNLYIYICFRFCKVNIVEVICNQHFFKSLTYRSKRRGSIHPTYFPKNYINSKPILSMHGQPCGARWLFLWTKQVLSLATWYMHRNNQSVWSPPPRRHTADTTNSRNGSTSQFSDPAQPTTCKCKQFHRIRQSNTERRRTDGDGRAPSTARPRCQRQIGPCICGARAMHACMQTMQVGRIAGSS